MSLQLSMNFKKHIWSCPAEYKDLSHAKEIAIDLETRDDGISSGLGAGWGGRCWGPAPPAPAYAMWGISRALLD